MSRKNKVPHANQTSRQRRLFMEALETRNLLAGNVTASVIGGTLFIRGDNAGNGVIVSEVGPNQYSVTGFDQDGDGTRIKTPNNGNGPVNNTLVFSGVTVNIDIALKQGDDALAVGNDAGELNSLFIDCFDDTLIPDGGGENNDVITPSAVFPGTLEVPLDLIINTGDGHDKVAVIAEARDGVILTGNHDDLVAVGGSFFSDDLIVDTGKGNDGVCIGETGVVDLLSVVTAQGVDGLDLFNSSLGSLVVAMGEGFDSAGVVGLEVEFGGSINVGNGGSEVDVFEYFGLALAITAANGQDEVRVSTSEIGSLAIVTGNHEDEVRVSSADLGAVSVVTGNGEDDVEMQEFGAQSVVVSTGNDHDEVHLQDFDAQSVVIDTGNGNDGSDSEESPITVENADIEFDLTIALGAGNDLALVQDVGSRNTIIIGANGDDEIEYFNSTAALDLIINTGNGNDFVDIFDVLVRRNASLVLGAGDDFLSAELLNVEGNATLDAGAGHDEVHITDSNVDGLFQAFMGAGNDFLEILGSTAGAARLFGGENSNDFDQLDADFDNLPEDVEVFQFEEVNFVL